MRNYAHLLTFVLLIVSCVFIYTDNYFSALTLYFMGIIYILIGCNEIKQGSSKFNFYLIIGLFVTAFVIYLYINSSELLERWGLFIIICGAIGNIVDRFINGYVIDFLYLHINQYYWPAFNFADIYISIGIIMIIVNMVKKIIKS